MKKILAVLIAISMVATMAFAADFSYEVETKGNVAEWATGSNDVTLLKNSTSFSVKLEAKTDDDKAGTSVTLKNATVAGFDKKGWLDYQADTAAGKNDGTKTEKDFYVSNSTIVASNTSVWIKPIDGVKVTFGKLDTNAAAIGDTKYGAVAADGFDVEYKGIENLTVNFGLVKGFKEPKDGVPGLAAKVAYKVAEELSLAATVDKDLNCGVAATGKVAEVVSYTAAFEKAGAKLNAGEAVSAVIKAGDDVTITVGENVKAADLAGTLKLSAGCDAKVAYDIFTLSADADIADFNAVKVGYKAAADVTVKGDLGAAKWSLGANVSLTNRDAKGKATDDLTVKVEVPYSIKLAF